MYWRQSRVKGSEETKFQHAGQKLIKAMVIKRTGISTLELGTPLTLTVMGGIRCQEEHFPKSLILYNGLFICFPIFFFLPEASLGKEKAQAGRFRFHVQSYQLLSFSGSLVLHV